ncbi:hypothetical protein FRC11_007611 [Ceratobasidium sp. 423]|nr:hypothetical protein FRC11_007611 [Ceratobasidium sp. 423]
MLGPHYRRTIIPLPLCTAISAFINMNNNHDHIRSALLTPQSSATSPPEDNHNRHAVAQQRAIAAIWSVVENSDTNDRYQSSKLAVKERQVNSLITLSGSLLAMLVQFGDAPVHEQSFDDLTQFVFEVMDAFVDKPREEAAPIAEFLFNHIQGAASTTGSPSVEQDAVLITPEEDTHDKTAAEEETATHSGSPVKKQVSRREYKPPSLNYDPTPIAKLGAWFLSNAFGPDTCAKTVVNYAPTLSEYITDVISAARTQRPIVIYALALLNRLSAYGSSIFNTFGLFLTAHMIASKMLGDEHFNNASWCTIGQRMFTLKELNEMERRVCADLGWNLDIGTDELEVFEDELCMRYDGKIDYYARTRVPTPIPDWAPVIEQAPASPPSSSPLETPFNFRARGNSYTPAPPEMPASSGYLVDSSPRWAPPSPSALRSTSSHQAEPRINSHKEVWVECGVTDYEDEGCDGNGDIEDRVVEDDEMLEVF